MPRPHWYGEAVDQIDTTLAQLPSILPTFERSPFGSTRHDVISLKAPDEPLPVALVSKRYALVQHVDAIRGVTAEIKGAGIDLADVPARLLMTEHGTRIQLSVALPDHYAFTPRDGHKVGLRFELFNSVDGSVPFLAALGWLRFVCSNGLVTGTTAVKVRQRHDRSLNLEDISTVLSEGTKAALQDRELFTEWIGRRVDRANLADWADYSLGGLWGPTAAARVQSIVTTGLDGRPLQRPRNVMPSDRRLVETFPVPGAEPCDNAFGVAQALSWVASRRNNVAERTAWRDQIPSLMDSLLTLCALPPPNRPVAETLPSSAVNSDEDLAAEIRPICRRETCSIHEQHPE